MPPKAATDDQKSTNILLSALLYEIKGSIGNLSKDSWESIGQRFTPAITPRAAKERYQKLTKKWDEEFSGGSEDKDRDAASPQKTTKKTTKKAANHDSDDGDEDEQPAKPSKPAAKKGPGRPKKVTPASEETGN